MVVFAKTEQRKKYVRKSDVKSDLGFDKIKKWG
jgi:hypothetical protein